MKIDIEEMLYRNFELQDTKGGKHYSKVKDLESEFTKKLTVEQLNEFKLFMKEYDTFYYFNCKAFGLFVLNFLRNVFNK